MLLLYLGVSLNSQDNKKVLALEKAKEAIQLMDAGNYEESIQLLEESKKLDPKNYVYPYEVALAYTYMENYKGAIKELKRTVKLPNINSQVFQLLGNSYSYSGQREKAIKTYEKGLRQFPDSGNLYLEIGNVHNHEENYDKAVESYEKGIEVDPMFTSNYYRLAKLYLASTNKVPGLIYGEIFMNLERTTDRTLDLSKLLYDTYESSIEISKDSTSVNFCQVVMVMDIESFNKGEELELPYCAIFGKNMILATTEQTEVTPQSLAEMRALFIQLYFQGDAEEFPVILFDYHKKMIEAGVFEAYNHYLFQMSDPERFEAWRAAHQENFDKFVIWYTAEENLMKIDKEHAYLRYP